VPPWTSEVGCGSLASNNMRRPSARIGSTTRSLPSLTAEDLKDLGVGFVGDRRKLLDAIAAVRAEASAPTPLSDAPLATDKAAQDTAERRQVTVMFFRPCRLDGLSARMDPEDLREVISAYQNCVAETVGRFGGFVAKYMGDGVLVYFGYPQAHEDDAEQAVRAGLDLGGCGDQPESPRGAANACRHCDRVGRCRRPDRIGCFGRTSNRWRDAKPCGTPARHCRAEQRRHCRRNPETSWQSF